MKCIYILLPYYGARGRLAGSEVTLPVILWYLPLFDSFGKWYGKEKCGMVKNILIVLGEVRRAER